MEETSAKLFLKNNTKEKLNTEAVKTIVFTHLKTILILHFTILCMDIKAQETVTDYDGNKYPTVTIGSQVWMKENLKTTHYGNGDSIPNVTVDTEWFNLTSGAYINYNNDSSMVTVYGRLYNWFVIDDSRNICPAGWHVPSNDERSILFNSLGGVNVAGGKMKETGTVHWFSPNTGASNSSGFTSLPAGYGGYEDALFGNLGLGGFWWSSTEHNPGTAHIYNNSYNYSHAAYFDGSKNFGIIVRCLKDETTVVEEVRPGDEVKIYPNPTSGKATLSFGTAAIQKVRIEVFDLQGNEVISEAFHDITTSAIDLKKFPSGIYAVKVVVNGEMYDTRIIKE